MKVFKTFGDLSKTSQSINAMDISYWYVFNQASKPIMKVNRLLSLKDIRKEYKKLLVEGWK